MNFRDWFAGTVVGAPPLVPSWLRTKYSRQAFYACGLALDVMLSFARQAILYRLPSFAHITSLPYVADARNIERYFIDTDLQFQTRVRNAWDLWVKAGSKARIKEAIEQMGFENVRIYSYRNLGGMVPDEWAGWTSAFWVFIGPPTDVVPPDAWDHAGYAWDDLVPGSTIGAPYGPRVWDAKGINGYEVAQLRAAIRKWKQGHEICAEIVFCSGPVWEAVPAWDLTGLHWDDGGPSVRIQGTDRGGL